MKQFRNYRLILVGVILSLVFWFLESVLHVFVFDKPGLMEQILRPQGHEIWMRFMVMVMFISFSIYVQRLLNARRSAEGEARLANAELNQIFETAGGGMRVVDRNFTVLRANDTFASLVGQPKQEIIGRKCYDVFRGDLCNTRGCPLIQINNGEEQVDYEGEKIRPDQSTVPCMVTATPFRRPDGELVGIVEDFKDVTEHRRSERELMESQERLRELASHLQVVREEERRRIALEIHDELGQALTALNMDLHWVGRRMPDSSKALDVKLQEMSGLIGTTMNSLRRICTELRPSILDEFGLTAAVEWQAEEFSKRTGIPCEFNADTGAMEMDQDLSVAVFRIFQETLTNIIRHAQARRVQIDLLVRDGVLDLCVCDDGQGIAIRDGDRRQRFGLIGIRERVRDFGGELRIDSGPDIGTRIDVRIPIAVEDAS